jgi:hypothetical protein
VYSARRWPTRANTHSSKIYKILNKHIEVLLRGTVLLLTLLKYAQQDAEPQNKNANTMHIIGRKKNVITFNMKFSQDLSTISPESGAV